MAYYSILNIKSDATSDEIKAAYRRQALQCHPDKNRLDEGANAAMTKINEAYNTLKDEHQRILYDAKLKIPRPGVSRAQGETSSTKDAETALRERLKKEKEEKEWTEKERIATENITRLEKEIEMNAASIQKHDRLMRERLEKETQSAGWWSFISSLAGTAEEKAEEKAKKRREEACQKDRLVWIQNRAQLEMKGFQDVKAEIKRKRIARDQENRERAARAREAEEAFARQQKEMRMKEAMRRAAQEARQKEEAVRQQEARERETRERDLREQLRQKMDAEAARNRTAAAAKAEAVREKPRAETARRANPEAGQASAQPPNPNPRQRPLDGSWQRGPLTTSNPAPQPLPTTPRSKSPPRPAPARTRGPAMPKRPQTGCAHKHHWPKVNGRHQCSACSRILPMYIFQCGGCGVMACNDCRKALKG